jgi:hypothetical protein
MRSLTASLCRVAFAVALVAAAIAVTAPVALAVLLTDPPVRVAPTSPRPDDRAGIRGVTPVAPVVVTRGAPGFDWGDAGIGAAAAATVLLLLGSGAIVTVSTRRHALPQS